MYRHILVPTDGSDLSKDAVQYGISLAKSVNAKVTGVTVTTPFHVFAGAIIAYLKSIQEP
jgi:nucleotide-binding universal stress UspA family protein